MKILSIAAIALICASSLTEARDIKSLVQISSKRLDEATKESVRQAAAAALKVAVAAKKAESAASIKEDMK